MVYPIVGVGGVGGYSSRWWPRRREAAFFSESAVVVEASLEGGG
uniref:Uncharacterized protein n=1 Tax=Rhizophora mucronata TaxID=61149 RepID=A0A2P2MCN9_RHIMU